jgi:hypothetical protein
MSKIWSEGRKLLAVDFKPFMYLMCLLSKINLPSIPFIPLIPSKFFRSPL